jgi:hypothetical protein
MQGGRPRIERVERHCRVMLAYTHPERAGHLRDGVEKMTGEEVFRLVAEHDDCDGLAVNRGTWTGRGENRLNALVLSPGIAHALLAGEDIRPGAAPLPARGFAEAELWLTLRRFPHEGRRYVDAPYPDVTLLRAVVPEGSTWRMPETLAAQAPYPDLTWSPVFALPPGSAVGEPGSAHGVASLGEGATRILCAGLLAQELGADWRGGEDAEGFWRPGRWLPLGRLVSAAEQAQSRRRLAIAKELAKLLPHGADRIPRSALLTVAGAAVAREFPHALSRAWIEATLRQAERYTRRWVR